MTRIIRTYHENGNIKEEYEGISDLAKDGYYRLFHKNGQLKVELNFTNGIQDAGTIISYHNNGVKAREVVLIENGFSMVILQSGMKTELLKINVNKLFITNKTIILKHYKIIKI